MHQTQYIIYLIFLLLNYKFIQAQSNTFSKLYPLKPLLASVFTSIEIDDNSYYVVGVGSIDSPGYPTASLFMRTNLIGEIEKITAIKDTNNCFETWFQSLVLDHDGNLVTHGVSRHPMDSNFLSFIKYNKDGELVIFKTFSASHDKIFEMSHKTKGALQNWSEHICIALTIASTHLLKVQEHHHPHLSIQLWLICIAPFYPDSR